MGNLLSTTRELTELERRLENFRQELEGDPGLTAREVMERSNGNPENDDLVIGQLNILFENDISPLVLNRSNNNALFASFFNSQHVSIGVRNHLINSVISNPAFLQEFDDLMSNQPNYSSNYISALRAGHSAFGENQLNRYLTSFHDSMIERFRSNDVDGVRLLLRMGADPNFMDARHDGNSLYHHTPNNIDDNYVEMDNLLAEYHVNVNLPNNFGITPAQYLESSGYSDAVTRVNSLISVEENISIVGAESVVYPIATANTLPVSFATYEEPMMADAEIADNNDDAENNMQVDAHVGVSSSYNASSSEASNEDAAGFIGLSLILNWQSDCHQNTF